jgi:hypothetical protein
MSNAWTSPLYGSLEISKLQFLIKKTIRNIFSCIFFNFRSSKPWIQIHLKWWIQWIRIHNTGLEVTGSGSQFSSFWENCEKNFFVYLKKMRRNNLWHWYFRIYLFDDDGLQPKETESRWDRLKKSGTRYLKIFKKNSAADPHSHQRERKPGSDFSSKSKFRRYGSSKWSQGGPQTVSMEA